MFVLAPDKLTGRPRTLTLYLLNVTHPITVIYYPASTTTITTLASHTHTQPPIRTHIANTTHLMQDPDWCWCYPSLFDRNAGAGVWAEGYQRNKHTHTPAMCKKSYQPWFHQPEIRSRDGENIITPSIGHLSPHQMVHHPHVNSRLLGLINSV